MERVILESIHTAGRQLNVRYSYDQYRFSTSFWYEFELKSLEEMYAGTAFMEKVYFTCASVRYDQILQFEDHVRSISDRILTWSLKNLSEFGGRLPPMPRRNGDTRIIFHS